MTELLPTQFWMHSCAGRLGLALFALAAAIPGRSFAEAYFFYPPESTFLDYWSTGTNWSATPVSGSDNSLVVGPNGYFARRGPSLVYPNEVVNDFASPFVLNALTMRGHNIWNDPSQNRTVIITWGTLDFRESSAGDRPTIVLSAYQIPGSSLVAFEVNSAITASAPLTMVGEGSASYTFGGPISGPSGIVKSGNSQVTFSGANSYLGGTTLEGGVIRLGSVGALGSSGPLAFTGGTLQFSESNTTDYTARFSNAAGQQYRIDTGGQAVTFASPLTSDGGTLTKLGAGTLSLTAANSYTGGTTFSGGVVRVASVGALGSSGSLRFNGGALQFSAANTVDYSGRFATESLQQFLIDTNGENVTFATGLASDGGTLTKVGDGTLTLAGNNYYHGVTTIFRGSVRLGDGGTSGSLIGDVSIGSGASLILDRSDAWTLPSAVTGAGTLRHVGSGKAMLTASNTPGGGAVVSAGTLQIGDGLYSGSLEANVSVGGGATLAFGRGNDMTHAGQITGAGAVSFLGGGTITLTGANSYTGATNLNAGGVIFGNTGARSASSLLHFNGGTLRYTSANLSDYSPQFSNSAGQQYRIDTNGQNVTAAASLMSPGGTLIKSGAGTLTLTGENSYSGMTTIAGGTLEIGTGGTNGSFVGDVSIDGGAALVINRSDAITLSRSISGGGTFRQSGSGTTMISGSVSLGGGSVITAGALQVGNGATSGSLSGNAAVGIGTTLAFNRSDAVTYDGAISGAGLVAFNGSGTTALTGANTHTGATQLNSGTLNLGSPEAFSRSSTIHFNGGTLQYSAASLASVPGTHRDYSANFSTAAGQQYRLDTNGVNVGVNTALISSGGSLTKSGAGSLYLSAANTYTGATTISGGTLVLDGAVAPSLVLDGNVGADSYAGIWYDQSGNGNDAVSNRSNYNLGLASDTTQGVVVGANSSFAVPLSASGDAYTLFTVYRPLGLSQSGTLIGSTVNGNLQLRQITGQIRLSKQGGSSLISAGVSGGQYSTIITGATVMDGAQTFSTIVQMSDGTIGTTTNSTASSAYVPAADGTFVIGNTGAGNAGFTGSGVTIGAVLVYNSVLSPAQVNRIQNTLASHVFYDDYYTAFSSSPLSLTSGSLASLTAINLTGAGAGLDLNDHTQTVGSLSGIAGTSVYLGQGTFTVGADHTSTGFEGIIQDGGGTSRRVGGSLTKIGSGTLTLSGDNLYSGGTVISGGTLQIGNGGTTGSIAGNVTNNSILAFNRSDATSFAGIVSGAGALSKLGAGMLTLTGANTHTGGTTISAGALQLGDGGTSGSLIGNVSNNGTLAFNRSDALSFTGIISGTGSLSKLGAGTLSLTAANTYTNGTIISAGTLQIGNTSLSSSFAIASGAVLELNSTSVDRDQLGASTFTGSGTLRKTGAGGVYWGASTAIFAMASGGLIDVQGGVIYAGSNANDVWTANLADLHVASGARFQGGEANVKVDALTGAGLIGTGSGHSSYQTFTFGVDNGSGTFSGVLVDDSSHAGNFTKAGSGTQVLTGTNTFTGGTTIFAGSLQIGDGGTTGSLAGNVINNGNFVLNRSDSFSAANLISGLGSVTKLGAGIANLTGDNTFTGSTTVSAGTLRLSGASASSSFAIATGATLDLNVVSGSRNSVSTTYSGSGTLVKSGGGSMRWDAGAATFAMAAGSLIDVQAGTFIGGSNANENWTGNFASLNVAAGATFYGVEANVRVDALTGGGTIFSGLNGAGYQNFTFGLAGGSGTFSGVLADFSTNTANFVKTGAGTQILSGENIYTGATTIEGGKLVVDGSIASSSLVTVSIGGTLGGHGVVGDVSVSGGTLSPGNSPGLLTIDGDLNLNGGATLLMQFEGTAIGAFDQIAIRGNFAAGGTLSLTVGNGYLAAEGDTFTLFTDGFAGRGWDSGSFIITSNLDGRLSWDTGQLGSYGVLSVVPEPSTFALFGLGVSLFVWPRRRRSSAGRI